MLNHKDQQVSICIPAFNAELYLPAMLDSIIKQSYKNLEIIVSDNASTDSTREIVESYIRFDKRIKYQCNKENIGYVRNIAKAVEAASNEIIAIFHADDLYEPTLIEKEMAVISQRREISGVFTKYRHFYGTEPEDRNEYIEPWECKLPYDDSVRAYIGNFNDFIPILLEIGNPFCCPSFMTRKDEYISLGGFTDNYPSNEDLELWVKYLNKGKKLAIVAETLVNYRHSPGQGSAYWESVLDLPVFYKVIDEMVLQHVDDGSSSRKIYIQQKANKCIDLARRVSVFHQKHRAFLRNSINSYRFPLFCEKGLMQRFPIFYDLIYNKIKTIYFNAKNGFRLRFPKIFRFIKKTYYKIFNHA